MEVRVKHPSDPYCDPRISTTWVPAYEFAKQVHLSPGQTLRHSKTWTPSAPGTYCFHVVEHRSTNKDNYQRVHSRTGSQVIVIN